MPGNYSLRRTVKEDDPLDPTEYNADHQQHINNLTPPNVDDYSSSAAEMRSYVDPGDVDSESLATSMAGEIERLRYSIKHIKGVVNGTAVPQWYSKSYLVTVPNYSVTSLKLANGATAIQIINDATSGVTPIGTNTTLVSRAITLTRTRVRVAASFSGSLTVTVAGGKTITTELLRNSTVLATLPGTVNIAVFSTTTISGSIYYVDTPGAGPFTYTLRMTITGGGQTTVLSALMTLEEIA